MKIWELSTKANDYENLMTVKNFNLQEIQSFNGNSKVVNWQPLAVKAMYGNRPFGDITSFHPGIPVVSQKVIYAIEDLMQGAVEILPTLCVGHELFILNVIEVLNCIDYSKAEYTTFPNSKRIMMFDKYAFIEEKVKNKHIFKIPENPITLVFVSDEFRQRILDSKLKGFKFELVWDSEKE